MPNVSIVLTRSCINSWERYWANRPNDKPLDLTRTLRAATVVADTSQMNFILDKDTGELWESDLCPGHVFIVSREANKGIVEHVVVTFRRNNDISSIEKQVRVIQKRAHDEVEAVKLAVPELPADITQPGEQAKWWHQQVCYATIQMSKAKRSSPEYGAWVKRKLRCEGEVGMLAQAVKEENRRLSDDGHQKEREAKRAQRALNMQNFPRDEFDSMVSKEFVFNDSHKLMLLPTIRWLLQEVDRLNETVAELSARLGLPKPREVHHENRPVGGTDREL